MKLFLLFLSSILLSLSCNRPSSSKINQGIDGIKLNADKQLNVAATMMDEARMAEAQNLLIKTLQNDSIRLTNADLYYINSFLAEIMYYSALFDQGINYSRRAKAIALEMKNDALQGSSDNFLGLFYLNKNFLDSAVINFKNALSLIKENDSTLWISRRYHVFNNLGETYLKLKNPDSVKYFTKKAIELCRKENIPRAYALGLFKSNTIC